MRSQGAQVSGAQAGPITTINVDSPGAVVSTNTVAINTASTTRTVSSVTATTVVVGGPGFGSLSDDDRITIVSPLPTLYEDAEAATSKTNALTTDAAGYANCYIVGGKYDILISGGGLTTTLRIDVPAVGGESNRSTIYNSGANVAWVMDTLRSLGAGDKIVSMRSAGSEKFSVTGGGVSTVTGNFTVTNQTTLGNVASTNGIANIGTITSTSGISSNTTVTGGTGVTATTGNLQATAGDVDVRRLIANNGTALVAGDFALSAGWGTTASIAVTSTAKDQRGGFGVTANGAGIAGEPTVTLTFKDGVFPEIPVGLIMKAEITAIAPSTAYWAISSTSTGSVTFVFFGLPVAGSTYSARYAVIG